MKEVTKCSISGIAFTMDTDAYDTLKEYLDTLRETYRENPDGAEIIADIEARIAELILSAQDTSHVVERPLILNIIAQMGSADDLSDEEAARTPHPHNEPRIPRRLYRDTAHAKLGGVCAGIGKYFDIDPVWVRLGLFAPLLLACVGYVPFLFWLRPTMSNLFGIFILSYLVMWFAVPAARTARQKLEMNGERITARSIEETTAATATDPDHKAKSIVAETVSILGKIVLIGLKIVLGLLVFGLILGACGLIIGLFALLIGGKEMIFLGELDVTSLWVPVLGIFIALIPIVLLIYVFMCLIISRHPNGKVAFALFLLWLVSIIACASVAIHENFGDRVVRQRDTIERLLRSQVVIDGDTTTLRDLLDTDDERIQTVIDDETKTLRISVPDQQINITVDGPHASVSIEETEDETASESKLQDAPTTSNASAPESVK